MHSPRSTDDTAPSRAISNTTLRRILAVAVLTQTAGSIVAQGVYVLVPIWREAFQIPLATASLAVTALNGAQIASMIALGRAIDRFGERLVVSLSMIIMALAAAGATFATHMSTLLLSMVVLGAAYAAVQPGGTRAIVRWFPPDQRGLATGLRQAAVPLGTAIAALALPMASLQWGWPAALWILCVVACYGAFLFWMFYREPAVATASGASTAAPLSFSQLRQSLGRDPLFRAVVAAGITMSALQFTLTAHVIGYVNQDLARPLSQAATLFAVAQLVGIPSRVVLPWLADRYRPGRRMQGLAWIMLAAAGGVAALAGLDRTSSDVQLIVVLVAFGIFGIGWFPLYILQVAEMAPRSSIATVVSTATTMCMIAMAIGPALFGIITDQFSYRWALLALVMPVVLAALRLLYIARARPDAPQSSPVKTRT